MLEAHDYNRDDPMSRQDDYEAAGADDDYQERMEHVDYLAHRQEALRQEIERWIVARSEDRTAIWLAVESAAQDLEDYEEVPF